MDLTIGLFGSCGVTTWRDRFIQVYKSKGINFFNPQLPVGTWKPEFAFEEARHLAEDEIILFPVTSGSFGLTSLSETPFSIIQTLQARNNRDVVILIDPKVDVEVAMGELLLKNPDPVAAAQQAVTLEKESNRCRALVRAHIAKILPMRGVYFVNTMDEMLENSLKLHEILQVRKGLVQLIPE